MAVAAAAAGVLLLSACGGSGSSDAGAGSPTSSSTSADAGSSSGFPGIGSLSVGDTVDVKALSAAGAAAVKKAGTVRISMDSAAAGGTLSGTADFGASTPAMSLSGEAQGQKISVVFVDGILYVKVPELGSKSWLKIDPQGDDQMSKALGAMLTPLTDQANPTRMMAAVPNGTVKVVAVGDATATVEQKVTPGEMKEFITELYGSDLAGQATSTGTVTVRTTLDDQARPVKVEVSGAGSHQTIRYTDWGADVSVTAPPADQIGTFQMPGSGMPSPSSS